MSENNVPTNQPTEADSKAISVKIAGQVQALSEEDKALFQTYSNEHQTLKIDIPEIKVNYDEDVGARGGFNLLTSEPNETGKIVKTKTFLGTELDVTILRTRFKFGYFDQDAGEKGMETLGTPELDDYKGEVNLWDNKEKCVIFTGQYKEFKKFIVANYPDVEQQNKGFQNSSTIKHTEILYVEYKGKVCRMYLAKTSRDQYWAYKEEIKGVPTFAFLTKLTTTKEKKGSTTYFPIHFNKMGETELKKYIALRKQLDKDLTLFDEARANQKSDVDSNTVQGGDPEEEIKKKRNLNFPEDFVYPNCTECGKKMVLRDSFKGAFFGCSDFPECKGIVNLSDVLKDNGEVIPTINLDKSEDEGEKVNNATAPTPEEGEKKEVSIDDFDEKKDDGEIKVENIPF